jgi:hypothetical protein
MKQRLLLIFSILFTLINCKANDHLKNEIDILRLFRKADPIGDFWNWFKENEKRLKKFEKDPDTYLNEVLTQAKKIQPGLAIEFELPKNGVINMTVSADGDKNIFAIVKDIVAKAPQIDGWKFVAFRQRMDVEMIKGMKLQAADRELSPTQMKFFPVITGDTLDLIIYVKGVTDENYNQVAYGSLLLLDNILGEYDCVTKVRSYDFHNMPTKKEELDGLLPLIDLPAYVDKFHSSKNR